jgi:urease accessory protein
MFDGPPTGWHAALALRMRRAGARTVFASRHVGALRVQKPLYPEGDAVCHVVLIHPPGGIAGGDALTLDLDAEAGTHALITTPGAAKWYKANGRTATQRVNLNVQGALEWLPQEAIIFDQADVRSEIAIELDAGAAMIGWDIVALGRAAARETFTRGCFAQTIRLRDGGRLVWIERTCISGGDALLASPIGLAGCHVFGCLWAVGPCWTDAQLESLRMRLQDTVAPLTRVARRVLIARALAPTTGRVRRALETVWRELRPLVLRRPAIAPRIWAT